MSRARRQQKYQRDLLKKVAEAQAVGALQPGQVYTLDVLHDADCPYPSGAGACSCTPDVGTIRRVPDPEEN